MPKIAVLMIHKDEIDLFEPWIIYHGELFGYENLYIWDNGSTDPKIPALIEKWTDRGVRFLDGARRAERFRDKGRIFEMQIKALERFGYYDFFLPLDSDEFVALKAVDGVIETRKDHILSAFDRLDPGADLFSVDYNYPNNWHNPRRFFGWQFNKRFVRRDSFVSMDQGAHDIVTRRRQEPTVTNFAFIHFHYRPFAHMRQNAIDKLILQPEILKKSEDELRKNRLGRYIVMSEAEYYQEFATMDTTLQSYEAPHLEHFFKGFGRELPFRNR